MDTVEARTLKPYEAQKLQSMKRKSTKLEWESGDIHISIDEDRHDLLCRSRDDIIVIDVAVADLRWVQPDNRFKISPIAEVIFCSTSVSGMASFR